MTVTRHEIDFIRAGPGDDTIIFSRTSWAFVVPGPGDDLIRGPALRGNHGTCVSLYGAAGPVRIDLVRGRATGQGRDRFPPNTRCAAGGRFNDVLLGTPRDDRLNAGYAADLVRAGAGDDDVSSGSRAGAQLGHSRRELLATVTTNGEGAAPGDR